MKEKSKTLIQCNECQAGVMRLHFITYFTWLGDELVTVPNFPAWICDVCGRREYDQRAISWLTIMLNPETGKNKLKRHQVHKQTEDHAITTRPRSD